MVELWIVGIFLEPGEVDSRKFPRDGGGDGFLWGSFNRWVEIGKFLKEW